MVISPGSLCASAPVILAIMRYPACQTAWVHPWKNKRNHPLRHPAPSQLSARDRKRPNHSGTKGTLMEIADRGRKSIGRIRRDSPGEMQQRSDHFLHLLFGSSAVTHNGEFDLSGGVLVNGKLVLGGHQQGNPAGLAELQCALSIAREKNLLKTNPLRLIATNDLLEAAINPAQAPALPQASQSADGPVGQMTERPTRHLDHSPPRGDRARVNAQDSLTVLTGARAVIGIEPKSHQLARSKSSLGMSKLAATLCTSSSSSSSSVSLRICSALWPSRKTVLFGVMGICAATVGIFSRSRRSLTFSKSSGRVTTSNRLSSSRTSSAPASRARLINWSSPTLVFSTVIRPFLSNIHATQPVSPRLPPYFEKRWRISCTVRFLLSVRA